MDVALLLVIFLSGLGNCYEFHQNRVGTVFAPYVKYPEGDSKEPPHWRTYKLRDVETMLNIVSTKFSKVATYGVGADNAEYPEDISYYQSNPQALTAEAAARINLENSRKSLTVLIGVWLSRQTAQMTTEKQVALESFRVANLIYKGTAEGFVLSGNHIEYDLIEATRLLDQLRVLRNATSDRHIKLGSRQSCAELFSDEYDTTLINVQKTVVMESDFIICEADLPYEKLSFGIDVAFKHVTSQLLKFREILQEINPDIEVMGETGWPSEGDNEWENIGNLEEYWNAVDRWCPENNYTMWMFEAFDQPWKDWALNATKYGWWQLISNDVIDKIDGYFEKIYGPPKSSSSKWTMWIYIGLGVGVAVLATLSAVLGSKYYISKQKRKFLTSEDVNEFMYGMIAEKNLAQQEMQCTGSSAAYKLPYDKSFEIPQDKLKIEKDCLLGAGQFGMVYKGTIENGEGETVVALKMAADKCSRSALKGILSEIKILIYLGKHPNIVSIYGACTENILKGSVYVALELCTIGSLKSYLKSSFSVRNQSFDESVGNYCEGYCISNEGYYESTVSPEDLLRWSHQIACGMEYLSLKDVVHADLSTRNVLLTADKIAKITDFGLSRKLYDYSVYVKKNQEPLPWRWMSIESLRKMEFSSKSDVWSYGVTLWEVFSLGDIPYPGYSWNSDFIDNLVGGLRMSCPTHASPAIYQIMLNCWKAMPEERPSFTDLKLSILNILGENDLNYNYKL